MPQNIKETCKKPAKKVKRNFIYKIAPTKLPSKIKKLQGIDADLKQYSDIIRWSYYREDLKKSNMVEDGGIDIEMYIDSSKLEYDILVDALYDELKDDKYRWDMYSNYILQLYHLGGVKCYVSFLDYTADDYVMVTASELYSIVSEYTTVVEGKRVVKEPLMFACTWLAKHLHTMYSKKKQCLLYSRSKGFYMECKKEDNERGLDTIIPNKDVICRIIDALVYNGYGINIVGYKDHVLDVGAMSMFITKTKLLDLLSSNVSYSEDSVNKKIKIERQLFKIKDDKKNVIRIKDYKQEWLVEKERSSGMLEEYNAYLKKSTLMVNGFELPEVYLTRIHSNSSVYEGGRLFDDGSWTTLPKEYREELTIDGMETKTIDLKFLHPSLLYHEMGIILPDDFDPYPNLDIKLNTKDVNKFIKFYDKGKYNPLRNLAKVSLLILLNSKNEVEAKCAIRKKLARDNAKGGTCRESKMEFVGISSDCIDNVITELKSHNSGIAHYFCTGVSLRLMKIDSEMMIKTISKLVSDDVCSLPLHDSVTVSINNILIAEQRLRESYVEVVGDDINFRVEIE